jgi:hypothetical protein
MPRLTKATVLDKFLDQFSDMGLDEQAFALAQVQAIHRQAQRQKERNVKPVPAEEQPPLLGPADAPF